MSFEIMASGNIATAPIPKTIGGKEYLTFTVTSNVREDEGQTTEWIDCLVGSLLKRRASKMRKGDGVWVRGHVTRRSYTHGNEHRECWQMQVNELITHRETYES